MATIIFTVVGAIIVLVVWLLIRKSNRAYQQRWKLFVEKYPSLFVIENWQHENGDLLHIPSGRIFRWAGWNAGYDVFVIPYYLDYISKEEKNMLNCFLSNLLKSLRAQERAARVQAQEDRARRIYS
jgi:hypothetical protein